MRVDAGTIVGRPRRDFKRAPGGLKKWVVVEVRKGRIGILVDLRETNLGRVIFDNRRSDTNTLILIFK